MKSAVLVIDVRAGFFVKNDLPAEAKEVVARINEVTRRARTVSVPVIFVQHEAPGSVNATLPQITSFGVSISVVPSAEISAFFPKSLS